MMEKEKDVLNDQLNDCKEKLLKFVEEKKQWEKDRVHLIENEKYLKEKQVDLERKIKIKGT